MKFRDIIITSFKNLFRQKLRTLLTIFSIVIGSTLISLVYAVIPGFENFLDTQLNTLTSPKSIEVSPTNERAAQAMLGNLGSAPQEYDENNESISFDMEGFKDVDIEKIEAVDGVKKVYEIPIVSGSQYVDFDDYDKRLEAGFVLYYPAFLMENLDLVEGRALDENDSNKAIISNQFLESLGVENPSELVGKTFTIHIKQALPSDYALQGDGQLPAVEPVQKEKDFKFEIVGITEKTILSNMIFVPFDDALSMSKFGRNTEEVLTDKDDQRFAVMAEIDNVENSKTIDEKIEELGFGSRTFDERKTVLNDMFNVLTIIFSSFGILAMAVSSLGILNTLIMAVYERTREIGVLKAIGATKLNIALLFTIEAALIGLVGGLIGLALGYSFSEILDIIAHKTFLASFETLSLSNITSLLFLAPSISTVVATLAGIYPAIRAANLDPVDALRYE